MCGKARAYNCQIRPAMLDSSSRVKWTNTTHQPAYLVGDEVSVPAAHQPLQTQFASVQ